MSLSPATLYRAWAGGFESWFAAPGSLLTTAKEDAPFFFEVEHDPGEGKPVMRHPHYGRFLRLEPDRCVELTWVTAGTKGAETVVTVELIAEGSATRVRLTHAGFADAESCDGHRQAWPMVLEHMERKLSSGG